jgi:outer membrane protein, multidrug efflux system
MSKRTVTFFFIVLAIFSGCSLMPAYKRPESPVSANWPTGPAYDMKVAGAESPLGSDLKWREFFTDSRLQHIIETALTHNRDLRVAALNVQKYRSLYRVQRNELFPSLDATLSSKKQRNPDGFSTTGHSMTTEQYTSELGINSWEIDFFGRIRSLEESALLSYFATEEARNAAQLLLISETATAYFQLAADRENLRLARATLASQEASYRLIQRRFEVGIATELDLRQVQTRVEAARVDISQYVQAVAQDENGLRLLIGTTLDGDLLPETLADVTALPDVSPGLPSEVLLHRPDILQAENLLKAANANIGAARAAFFPRISLTTTLGTMSGNLSGLFDSGTDTWQFQPKIVMPIFDARTRPALEVVMKEREIAQTRYEKAIQTAFREVADALAVRGTISERITAQKALVTAVNDAYRLANTRYEKGIDGYLGVLDAQRSLYAAEQGLIAFRLNGITNQVRLYAALGGGGKEEKPSN